jgi:hypothetical protein
MSFAPTEVLIGVRDLVVGFADQIVLYHLALCHDRRVGR